MVEIRELGFNPGFVPTKNLQYFLLVLGKLKRVRGRTKLFKIHSLIEEEGHVKYNGPIDTYPLGPVDYETFNFCEQNGLIEDNKIISLPHDFYEVSLTQKGRIFFRKFCIPNMEKKEIEKALKIISNYRSMSNKSILEHVHNTYVDKFKDRGAVEEFIFEATQRINIVSNIVGQIAVSDGTQDDPDTLLGELRQLTEILKSLRSVTDPTKIGTILVNLSSFLDSLKMNGYKRNVVSIELFEFLDHYADKEKIQKSITCEDFSDIPAEEREKLFEAILNMEIPPREKDAKVAHACTAAG